MIAHLPWLPSPLAATPGVQVLIGAGSFVDVVAVCGTPLHCAARHGRVEAAQLLLSW